MIASFQIRSLRLALPFFRLTVSFNVYHLPFNSKGESSRNVESKPARVWKMWNLWKKEMWKMWNLWGFLVLRPNRSGILV